MACDAFVDALDDPRLEQRVRDKLPETLDDALRYATVMEAHSRSAEAKSFDRLKGGNRYVRAAYGSCERGSDVDDRMENSANPRDTEQG